MIGRMKNLIKRMPSLLNCILIALFASVVITGYMTIDIMAKFTTFVEVEDAARTAGFKVTVASAQDQDIALDAFDAEKLLGEYKFSVSSEEVNEVAAKYAVAIDFPKALPAYLTVMVDGKTGTMSENSETNVATYRFEDANWVFAPNSIEVREHKLTFSVAPGWQGDGSDIELSDLSVSVRVEQVD